MGCISVDLNIEDMSATGKGMVRTLDLRLVFRSALEVYRDMVRVGVIILVSYSRYYAELLLVSAGEAAGETFCWGSQYTIVVLICLAELVDLAAHERYDAQTKFLCFRGFSMMLSYEGDKAFCQTYESYTEGSVVDHAFDGVIVLKFLAVHPKGSHQ